MADELKPGVSGELSWTVTPELCTQRGDKLVFSTPSLVFLVERACVEVLQPYLQEGQHSVGTRVHVKHQAPTLRGMTVRARVTVREVDRRRVTFDVTVFDDLEQVGEADHDRFIIDVPRYVERLETKQQQYLAARGRSE